MTGELWKGHPSGVTAGPRGPRGPRGPEGPSGGATGATGATGPSGAVTDPSDPVTTTTTAPTDIGDPIEIPEGLDGVTLADIRITVAFFDASNGKTGTLRRALQIVRAGSDPPEAGDGGGLDPVDDVNAADTGVDLAVRFTATAVQFRVVGLAATTIRWRLFVRNACFYT